MRDDIFWLLVRCAVGAAIAGVAASKGVKKGSLSRSGAVAAFLVGALSLGANGTFGAVLLTFYFTGSKLTRVGSEKKKRVERDFVEGGQRTAQQVLACSALATAAAIAHCALSLAPEAALAVSPSELQSALAAAVLGHYACCAGDTYASELGVAYGRGRPFLLTSLSFVPPGTNGAMSLVGTAASILGGAVMGATYFAVELLCGPVDAWHRSGGTAERAALLVAFGAAVGFGGSLLDSALGATLQATYFDADKNAIVAHPTPSEKKDLKRVCGFDILSNEAVNLVSVAATTLAAAVVGPRVVPF